MKIFRIISHPYLLIGSFLLILISGESWGGFYIWYLAMALPHGLLHALAAAAGIALLVLNREFLSKEESTIKATIDITGLFFFLLSLFIFFYQDKEGYNSSTFEQVVPQLSLVVFGIMSLLFLVRTLLPLFQKRVMKYK